MHEKKSVSYPNWKKRFFFYLNCQKCRNNIIRLDLSLHAKKARAMLIFWYFISPYWPNVGIATVFTQIAGWRDSQLVIVSCDGSYHCGSQQNPALPGNKISAVTSLNGYSSYLNYRKWLPKYFTLFSKSPLLNSFYYLFIMSFQTIQPYFFF